MRKFNCGLKATLFLIAILATIGMFTACGGDDGGGPSINEEELTGGDSRTWTILEGTTESTVSGQTTEQDVTIEACQKDNKYVFTETGSAWAALEGADPCPVGGVAQDSVLDAGAFSFDADENYLIIPGGLYAVYQLGLNSDTLQVEELTADRMTLSHEITASPGGIETSSKTIITFSAN